MSAQTSIEWTDFSWSPWWGCTPVSPGCANCYAAKLAKFFRGLDYRRGVPRQKAKNCATPIALNRKASIWRRMCCPKCGYRGEVNTICPTPDCNTSESEMDVDKPRIFPSMCDIFDDEVPSDWRAEFFDLVFESRNLDWLILTKRPENARDMLLGTSGCGAENFKNLWPNLWIGVSAENQFQAEERIPYLLEIPAVVRFVSVEPMISSVALSRAITGDETYWDFLRGQTGPTVQHLAIPPTKTEKIDWVIYGGESGRGARPCCVDWLTWGLAECQSAGVPAFLKQLGSKPYYPSPRGELKLKHSKGGNPDEWPNYVPRVRQFPIPRYE